MRRVYASTSDDMQSATRTKRVIRVIGVAGIAIAIVAVLVVLRPPLREEPSAEAALVTYDCTELAATSMRAHADLVDDGGRWVTRIGFQYALGASGELPDAIALTNAGFEHKDPPEGWELSHGGGATWERSDEHVRVGSYSVKLSVTTNYGSIVQDIAGYEEYRGKTVTFGAWVYHPTVDEGVYLHVFDGVKNTTMFSSTATSWEWLTVTVNVDSNATRLSVRLRVSESRAPNTSGWFDGAFLVQGSSLGVVFDDGEFGTGAYSLDITGLEPETMYVIRAFAENRAGVSYGNTVTCRTPAA